MIVEFIFTHATQAKEVIPHATFVNLIKPLKDRQYVLGQIDRKYRTAEEDQEIIDIKVKLAPYSGAWCTDESPMGLAIKTGNLILPANQGGTHPVKIRII